MKSKIFMQVSMVLLIACGNGQRQQTEDPIKPEKTMTSMENKTAKPLDSVKPKDRLDYYDSEPASTIDDSKKYIATIKTNKGDVRVELDELYAEIHTNNFVFLARQGFYDGLTWHRHVPGFIIQGGDPIAAGTGGPGYKIKAEIGLPHDEGVIAMARQPDSVNPQRKSSGSQFYITLAATHQLDGQYSVFGKVIQGFDDVVMRLTKGDQIIRVDIEEK